MSFILVSSIIGTISIIVSIVIIYSSYQHLSISFDDKSKSFIQNINNDSKKLAANDIANDVNNTSIYNRINGINNTIYDYNGRLDYSKSSVEDTKNKLYSYEDKNNKNISVIAQETAKLSQESDTYRNLFDHSKFRDQAINVFYNKNKIKGDNQDKLLEVIDSKEKSTTQEMVANKSLANNINSQFFKKELLLDYTKNNDYNLVIQEWEKIKDTVNADFNKIDNDYNSSNRLKEIKDTTKKHRNRYEFLSDSLKNSQKNFVSIEDLKKTKFPITSFPTPPEASVFFDKMRTSISNTKSLVTDANVKYVKKPEFRSQRDIVNTISYPMFQFPNRTTLNINGKMGIKKSSGQLKLECKENDETKWSSLIQNKDTIISLSKGDGNGVKINTTGVDKSKDIMTINNNNIPIFKLLGDGSIDAVNITADTIKGSNQNAQLCINNTCIFMRDLIKVPSINIPKPTQTRQFNNIYDVEASPLVLNLNDYFTDVTKNINYSVSYNPYSNATISSQKQLIVNGNYRNRSYSITIRASNQFGEFIDVPINIKEPFPVDCKVSEWGNWESCSASCGGGTQIKRRFITQNPAGPVAPCPHLTEQQSCNTHQCSTNCVAGPWTAWSQCSATCGGGIQSRTRQVFSQGTGSGYMCSPLEWGLNGLYQKDTISCNTQACAPPRYVIIYQHCWYEGYQVVLYPGRYDMYDLISRGMINDDISSIKCFNGASAQLFEHAGFQGRSLWTANNIDCFVNHGFNDIVSSIIVN